MADLGGVFALGHGIDDGLVPFSHPHLGIVATDRKGQPALLLGGQPSKYRENFERKFNELTDEVQLILGQASENIEEDAPAA